MVKVCPLISINNIIVNIDYKLTFLEFYEIALSCIAMNLQLELSQENDSVDKINISQETMPKTLNNQVEKLVLEDRISGTISKTEQEKRNKKVKKHSKKKI